jgi:hypothetical protein
MNNKAALTTILGTALLGLAKVNAGSRNEGITIETVEDLIRYSQDPELAKTVTKVGLGYKRLTRLPESIGNLVNLIDLSLQERDLASPSRTFVLRGLLSGTFSPKVGEKIMPYLPGIPRNNIRRF